MKKIMLVVFVIMAIVVLIAVIGSYFSQKNFAIPKSAMPYKVGAGQKVWPNKKSTSNPLHFEGLHVNPTMQ